MKNSIGTLKPEWTSATFTLLLLRDMGLDPASEQARRAVELVRDNIKWDHDGQDYFDGEVEPCINGKAVALGAYFGQNVDGIVERLLGEQLADGGWNCEAERGSIRSSFNTTIAVLEGLLEYEGTDGAHPGVAAARLKGQEYLLERRMFRRLSTGEVIDPAWTQFSFPTRWHYDVLRGLDYLRSAGVEPDETMRRGHRPGGEQERPRRTMASGEHPSRVEFTSTWRRATASRAVGTPFVPCACSRGPEDRYWRRPAVIVGRLMGQERTGAPFEGGRLRPVRPARRSAGRGGSDAVAGREPGPRPGRRDFDQPLRLGGPAWETDVRTDRGAAGPVAPDAWLRHRRAGRSRRLRESPGFVRAMRSMATTSA